MESKPAATRSVSGLSATFGAKISRRRKPSNAVSISRASIMLGDSDRPADFARARRAGQGADGLQARGNFIRREIRAAEGADRFRIRVGRIEDDIGFDDFAEVWMRPAVHARLAYGGMAIEHGFNFLREHFASGQIDDRGLARDEVEKSIFIE